ncbi:hypothetical protein GCM10022222_85670 [Amycolatopsis ultiminotia]|uniref:Serine/threonine protein kinase n=1 Tax=Amycolatopsis ultiminotia TaxID=543629 RepID=A0ABP6YRM3_9PSEU
MAAGGSPINFRAHEVRANTHGARQDFEEMIGQLVRAVRPGVAAMIAANPGDWGIDVFIGDLGGHITIWQSKYFMPEVAGSTHQAQIRESFNSAVKNAANEKFVLHQWVLCVPSSMDAPTSKWWSGWKKRTEKQHGVLIELWDENELRGLLLSPDAEAVRRHYYEPARSVRTVAQVVNLADEDSDRLDSALFVRQLREAGHVEVSASKHQFFNAELMAREIVDKGVPSEVAALSHADAAVHGLWEDHFNDACQIHEGSRLPGLQKSVMGEIRTQHEALGAGLPAGAVHTSGLMHRVVDDRRAGWVRHWRQVAEDHVTPAETGQSGETSDTAAKAESS